MNGTNARNIEIKGGAESEALSARIRVILFFISNRQPIELNGTTNIAIDEVLPNLPCKIEDNEEYVNYTTLDDFPIYINSTDENDYITKSEELNKHIEKLCEKYKEIIVQIYIPTDNEASIPPGLFLKKYCPNFLKKEFKYIDKINKNKSFITYLYLSHSPFEKSESPNEVDLPPSIVETQICAILSHYVYFYLDWLELNRSQFYCIKTKSIEEQDILNVLLFKEGKSMLSLNQESKAKFRIISRINEILNIVYGEFNSSIDTKSDVKTKSMSINNDGVIEISFEKSKIKNKSTEDVLESTNTLIYREGDFKSITPIVKKKIKIIQDLLDICSKQGMPVDFYYLYEKCGYWEYLIQKGAYGKNIAKEAIQWKVLNPYKIFNKEKGNNLVFFKSKIKQEKAIFSEYYTGLLETGMGGISGYGGLLFLKNPDGQNPTFVYCTKGTDFNSVNDWLLTNILQGLTGFSLQHMHTVKNAQIIDKEIRESYKKARLIFTGHSLGGGLASSNTIISKGRHGITFNAAGLNFVGVLATRMLGVINGDMSLIRPATIAKRVHPIRIKGEAVDVLMIGSKFILLGVNERGYGKHPLEIDLKTPDGLRPLLGNMSWKHGINLFLHYSIINQLKIVDNATVIKADRTISADNLTEMYSFSSDSFISFFDQIEKND